MTVQPVVLPTRSASKVERIMQYLGIPLAALTFVALYIMPTPAGLTWQGQMALAVFTPALILWVSKAMPVYATAMLAMVMLVLTGGWTAKSVMGVFGYDVIWLMVCAFILTSAMIKTNLARRIALFLVTTMGRRAKWAQLSMIIVNLLLAFLVPSTTARAALMLPIVIILAEVYGAVPGKSRFGAALMIQELQANNIFTSAIVTATACNIMAQGWINEASARQVYYIDWLIAQMPIAIITMLLSWFIGQLLFKPEYDTPKGEGMDVLRRELKELGPMSADEWKAAAVFSLAVILWFTDKWHIQLFGMVIDKAVVAILAATLTFMPGINLLTWKETKIPWDLMIFSCGAYAAGMALQNSGAAKWVLDRLFEAVGIQHMNFWAAYVIVLVVAMFSHVVFTSKTVRTTIVIPMVIAMALSMGIDPMALALPAAFTMAWSITLPPHCKPNLIFYGTGHFTVIQQLTYSTLVCIIGLILLIIAGPTWFALLGITIP